MKSILRISLIATALIIGWKTIIAADAKSHQAVTDNLFKALDLEKQTNSNIDQMLDAQIKANPTIAVHKEAMKKFLMKYTSWEALKEDMTKIYMETYSEDEMNELVKFYNTPVGKKVVEKMPELAIKQATLGMSRFKEHQAELIKAVQADEKEKADVVK